MLLLPFGDIGRERKNVWKRESLSHRQNKSKTKGQQYLPREANWCLPRTTMRGRKRFILRPLVTRTVLRRKYHRPVRSGIVRSTSVDQCLRPDGGRLKFESVLQSEEGLRLHVATERGVGVYLEGSSDLETLVSTER